MKPEPFDKESALKKSSVHAQIIEFQDCIADFARK